MLVSGQRMQSSPNLSGGIASIQNCLAGCGNRKCAVEETCPLVPLSCSLCGSGKEAELEHVGSVKKYLVPVPESS